MTRNRSRTTSSSLALCLFVIICSAILLLRQVTLPTPTRNQQVVRIEGQWKAVRLSYGMALPQDTVVFQKGLSNFSRFGFPRHQRAPVTSNFEAMPKRSMRFQTEIEGPRPKLYFSPGTFYEHVFTLEDVLKDIKEEERV